MYCPLCGHQMQQIERDIAAEENAAIEEWIDNEYHGEPRRVDQSEHWTCSKCSEGLYFSVHHPFKGPDSKPGDSWSVSWIK